MLQRNTTQFDTQIQQRDALVDYMRQGKACGYRNGAPTEPEGLKACATDADCASEGDFVCACPATLRNPGPTPLTCHTQGRASKSQGRCVRRDCRDQVAAFHEKRCASSPTLEAAVRRSARARSAARSARFLACVDDTLGEFTDNRLEMIGR